MSSPSLIGAVVLDIEGTTTSISFVADVMFPYVRRNLQTYLDQHWDEAQLQADVKLLRELSQEDAKNGVAGVPVIPEEGDKATVLGKVVENVTWQMDQDRKSTALKALQGHMWESGFASGELIGDVYEDVIPFLKRLDELMIPTYIYSSGSVHAQKLLFGHTAAGDLLHFFKGHFDTTIGLKVESPSYDNITKAIGVAPEHTLFATDNILEAYAAEKAGWHAALADRPGNKALPEGHHFPVVDSLYKLLDGTDKFAFPKDVQ
jgi:enolase-phosphatase E1